MFGLLELGVLGLVLLVVLVVLLPIVLTILVGIAFANMFGFTGIYWWAFVVLFYIVVSAVLGAITI